MAARATTTLQFDTPEGRRAVTLDQLVVGGWTGRDKAALDHHIEELVAIGVAPPSTTPLFYRNTVDRVMQAGAIQVVGAETSGEVEAVLVAAEDGLWVTVGSDHTDRAAEAHSVALSKQLCPKVLAGAAWRYDEIVGHWDDIVLRARATIDGKEVLYQEGKLAAMRHPEEMMALYCDGRLPAGTAMMLGTFAAIGGIRPAARFAIEMDDPKLGRRIAHAYDIATLPIVS